MLPKIAIRELIYKAVTYILFLVTLKTKRNTYQVSLELWLSAKQVTGTWKTKSNFINEEKVIKIWIYSNRTFKGVIINSGIERVEKKSIRNKWEVTQYNVSGMRHTTCEFLTKRVSARAIACLSHPSLHI